MSEVDLVSACCSAPVRVKGVTTHYYVCTRCGTACNTAVTSREEPDMSFTRKTLDLKITVADRGDPDETLAKLLATAPKSRAILASLHYSRSSLDVVKIERADGQQIGLEAEFETYWSETHLEGDEQPTGYEKAEAREAFLYGVKYGKGS